MGIQVFEFDTEAERDAFIKGVEYVNDSAIEITGKGKGLDGKAWVRINDKDQQEGQ